MSRKISYAKSHHTAPLKAGGDVDAGDFAPTILRRDPPKSIMKARPDVRLGSLPAKKQKDPDALAPTSFRVHEAEALLGARYTLVEPPHNLVPRGALGVVAEYKRLADEIVLMVRWPDGSHDWFLKSEVAAQLASPSRHAS